MSWPSGQRIGAGRQRLAQLLLVENLLLGLAGGACGLVLATWLIRLLPAVAPADFPRLDDVALDGPVLLFALAITVAASLLFGAGPALQAMRVNLVDALNDGGGSIGGGLRRLGVNRARSALLIGEIALAIMLLVGAGLLVRSFVALVSIATRLRSDNVLTARVSSANHLAAQVMGHELIIVQYRPSGGASINLLITIPAR